jgi:predicted Zn-dependent protease
MKIFPNKQRNLDSDNNLVTSNSDPVAKNLLSQLFSPAMGLAILGLTAFIFSFYRAGQLSTLVVPKDEGRAAREKITAFHEKLKIDINSPLVVESADTSEAAVLGMAGEHQQAVNQALTDLTNYPPNFVPTILEAGDVLLQYGDDKQLGMGLLGRAVALAPNNQYIALRYSQRLISADREAEAETNLLHLSGKYPQWPDPHIALSKLHFIQDKLPQATTELIHLSNSKDLNSKQEEQVSLMLAKLGRLADGFSIFQKAVKVDSTTPFYASYGKDCLDDSYEITLARVKSNLAENKNTPNISKQLSLEIKQGALLLLLNRAGEAQSALEGSINSHPKNFDLHILQAAAYVQLGQNAKAKAAFQTASDYYQPK